MRLLRHPAAGCSPLLRLAPPSVQLGHLMTDFAAEYWKSRALYEHAAKVALLNAIRNLIKGEEAVTRAALRRLLWSHGETVT